MNNLNFSGPQDDKHCFAHGCPAYPTLQIGGEWTCRWHLRRSGSQIPHVTKQLVAHWDLIKWHDVLFCSTVVDFDMGEIQARAPLAYAPLEDEKYWEYKARIRKMINDMLFLPKVK